MICKTLDQIEEVAQRVLDQCAPNAIVLLQGDLAAGKTTLVKAIASLKGVTDEVTSPTFSLQQCYGDKLFHYDVYNHGLDHFINLGLLEELEKEGLHLIEWGDTRFGKFLSKAGFEVVIVNIEKKENQRCYRIEHA